MGWVPSSNWASILDPFYTVGQLTEWASDPDNAIAGLFGYAKPGVDTKETMLRTRKQLILGAIVVGGLVAAPAVYSAALRRKKRLTEREIRTGMALEQASAQITQLGMVALASPPIAAGLTYIGIQKLEDAQIISRSLGNAAQGLMTVAAAGPIIQGIGQIATSAFRKGK